MGRPFPPSLGSSCSPSSDPPDLVPIGLDEPEGAMWTRRDGSRAAIGGRKGELADRPTGRDAPDHSIVLGEPEVAIRAHRDISRAAISSRDGEFGDRAGATGRDAPDLVPKVLGEPEVAIWTRRDALGTAVECWDRKLGDRPTGRDTPDTPLR